MKKTFTSLMVANLLLSGLIGFSSLGAVIAQPTIKTIRSQKIPENSNNPIKGVSTAEIGIKNISPAASDSFLEDPFKDMFIDALSNRAAGVGDLEDLGLMSCASRQFSRYSFRYPSEGMQMYGFINIPEGKGPFPVIILLHGHVQRLVYNTVAYTTRYADALADQGYIVIHPNLRGYLPTPDAENKLGVGDTVDILNLLAIIRRDVGGEGLLQKADGNRIGLWGHSMGGGIVMRILEIDGGIKAGLLYASVHADEKINLAHFKEDGRGYEKCTAPEESLARISPLGFLDRIQAPVSIVHGDQDERVPVQWSDFLYEQLKNLGKEVTYKIYPGQLHTFHGSSDEQFITDSIRFFDHYLK